MISKIKSENRLVYAAFTRCPCGAGMAYDTVAAHKGWEGKHWDCSDILLGQAIPKGQEGSVKHEAKLPFVFWSIITENSPRAKGTTTRQK